jgi:hypothetical protein
MGNDISNKENPEKEILFNHEGHKKFFFSMFKKLKK